MSINFCTLTNASVDTFCGNRRSVVLNNLLQKKYPPVVTSTGGGSYQVRNEFAFNRPEQFVRPEEQRVLQFEQPFITVSAELMGMTGMQQIDLAPQLEFVVISDLQFPEPTSSVTVNITDFSL